MLSLKMERICCVLVWYVTLVLLLIVFPVKEESSGNVRQIYLVLSWLITIGISRLYVKKRDTYLLKKRKEYIGSNRFEEYRSFLEKHIEKNKKSAQLKTEKLFTLAAGGNISEFHIYLQELFRGKHAVEINCLGTIILHRDLFAYLTHGVTPQCESLDEQNSMSICVWLLSRQGKMPSRELIRWADNVYNTPYLLCRSVSALILSKEYRALGDEERALAFAEKAKEYAPSTEVLQGIVARLEDAGNVNSPQSL